MRRPPQAVVRERTRHTAHHGTGADQVVGDISEQHQILHHISTVFVAAAPGSYSESFFKSQHRSQDDTVTTLSESGYSVRLFKARLAK
jgi:hypothetical protein